MLGTQECALLPRRMRIKEWTASNTTLFQFKISRVMLLQFLYLLISYSSPLFLKIIFKISISHSYNQNLNAPKILYLSSIIYISIIWFASIYDRQIIIIIHSGIVILFFPKPIMLYPLTKYLLLYHLYYINTTMLISSSSIIIDDDEHQNISCRPTLSFYALPPVCCARWF